MCVVPIRQECWDVVQSGIIACRFRTVSKLKFDNWVNWLVWVQEWISFCVIVTCDVFCRCLRGMVIAVMDEWRIFRAMMSGVERCLPDTSLHVTRVCVACWLIIFERAGCWQFVSSADHIVFTLIVHVVYQELGFHCNGACAFHVFPVMLFLLGVSCSMAEATTTWKPDSAQRRCWLYTCNHVIKHVWNNGGLIEMIRLPSMWKF